MKTIIFSIFMFYSLFAIGQEKQFKHFQVERQRFSDNQHGYAWIIPSDFRQAFESLQQEYQDLNLDVALIGKPIPPKDCLSSWLCGSINVYLKDEAAERIRKRCKTIVPETLRKRLEEHAEKHLPNHPYTPLFWVQVLVDNQGNVLSVYFELTYATLLEAVQEEELKAISDNIKKWHFTSDEVVFAQVNRKRLKQIVDSLNKLGIANLTEVQRREANTLLEKAAAPTIPVKYGVVTCFELQTPPAPEQAGKTNESKT